MIVDDVSVEPLVLLVGMSPATLFVSHAILFLAMLVAPCDRLQRLANGGDGNGWGLRRGRWKKYFFARRVAFQVLGEMGIVFFLFEMGLELSLSRLMAMKRDVFGMGLATFGVSAASVAGACYLAGLTGAQMVVIGGGVALSSSAFVLQLLRDRDDMGTRYGRACFGILLFQVG